MKISSKFFSSWLLVWLLLQWFSRLESYPRDHSYSWRHRWARMWRVHPNGKIMVREFKEETLYKIRFNFKGSAPVQFDRDVAGWMWTLFFSFAIPQICICLNSIKCCISHPKLWRRPRFVYFVAVAVLESGQAIGMGLLFGFVLPRLTVRSSNSIKLTLKIFVLYYN